MSKKKSTTKSEPLREYRPFVDASLNASQGVFNEWQPKINERANQTLGVFDKLLPGAAAGIGASQGLVNDTLGGKYLMGNPYLDSIIGQQTRDIQDGVNSQFTAAGRYGSGAHQGVLARQIAEASDRLRFQNYGMERQNQINAVGQANELMNGTMGTLNQGLAMPWIGASNLTNNVSNATAGYRQQTSTQKGSALDTLGQVAAIGATVAPAFSDPRIKTNVQPVGQRPDGLGVYNYDNLMTGQNETGVMADEVAAKRPDALGPTVGGLATVDYGKLQQDAADLTPRVQKPGIMGAIERVISPDTSTTLGKVGMLGQNMLAAYGNPLGQALLGVRENERRTQADAADEQYRQAVLEMQRQRANQPNYENVSGVGLVEVLPNGMTRVVQPEGEREPTSGPLAYLKAMGIDPMSDEGKRLLQGAMTNSPVAVGAQIEAARGRAEASADFRAPPKASTAAPRYVRAPNGKLMKWVP